MKRHQSSIELVFVFFQRYHFKSSLTSFLYGEYRTILVSLNEREIEERLNG